MGILAVKKTDGREDFQESESPAVPFERIRKRHIREVLSGAISSERYLDGKDALAGLERAIQDLKRDDVFERLFFDAERTARMRALSIREQTDSGKPTVAAEPDSEVSGIYKAIARQLASSIAARSGGEQPAFPTIKISKET